MHFTRPVVAYTPDVSNIHEHIGRGQSPSNTSVVRCSLLNPRSTTCTTWSQSAQLCSFAHTAKSCPVSSLLSTCRQLACIKHHMLLMHAVLGCCFNDGIPGHALLQLRCMGCCSLWCTPTQRLSHPASRAPHGFWAEQADCAPPRTLHCHSIVAHSEIAGQTDSILHGYSIVAHSETCLDKLTQVCTATLLLPT